MEKMTIRKRLADYFMAIAKRLEGKEEKPEKEKEEETPFVDVTVKNKSGIDIRVVFTEKEINEMYADAVRSVVGAR